MKGKASDTLKFAGPEPLRLYLFHGVDVAGSRAAALRLADQLGGERTHLDPGGLKGDPGKLVDEAAGMGLFGDRKTLWIEPVGNDFAAAAEALLGAPATEHPVVAIAGTLTKASKLLKLVEPGKQAVALVSYEPNVREIVQDVERVLKERGLGAEAGVAERIASSCDLNREIAAQEIEKIALFIGDAQRIGHDDIDAVGADYGETEWLRVGDAAMDGDVEAVEDALSSLSPTGTEATSLLRAMQRRIQQLLPLAARVAGGEPVARVIESQGRALFWKDKALVSRLLGRWPAPNLDRLAARVSDAERKAMLEADARKPALGEELLAIARVAQRRSRR